MTCSCPKCHAQIEIDFSSIPENGTFKPCPECNSRFWINKESYARMALKKDGNIYCDKCGKELDHLIVCAECGVMYPDYYVVQASKPPRRQVEKADLFSFSFTLRQKKITDRFIRLCSYCKKIQSHFLRPPLEKSKRFSSGCIDCDWCGFLL